MTGKSSKIVLNNSQISSKAQKHKSLQEEKGINVHLSNHAVTPTWRILYAMAVFQTEGGDVGCKIKFEDCNSD